MKNTAKVLDNMTEAQMAIMSFELWQDMLIDGTAPDPKRYETEVLDFYKESLKGTNAPFYFLFMGFLGGLDFANQTKKAQELLTQVQDVTVKTCINYKEEMSKAAKEYEQTLAGRRFVASINNAKKFYFKHSKGTLYASQLNYLSNKHYNSLLAGSFDLTALAYRTGYNAGKAAAKK